MKINVEIDLEGLWCEEDESISEAIKTDLLYQAKGYVWRKAEEDVKKEISSALESEIKGQIQYKIMEMVKEVISAPELKIGYETGTFREIVSKLVEKGTNGYRSDSLEDIVSEKSKEISKELKERYDLLFASQLVSKLNEQGMLKSDVAKILLEKPKEL